MTTFKEGLLKLSSQLTMKAMHSYIVESSDVAASIEKKSICNETERNAKLE